MELHALGRMNVLGALCLALLAVAPVAAAQDFAAASFEAAPVADAAEQGNLEALSTMLRNGADVNAPHGDGLTALHWAAAHDDVEMANVLIYAGAHLEARTQNSGHTPLHLASRRGNANVTRILVEAGADATARTSTGVTSLHFAAGAGSAAVVNTLIEHGAEIDARESAAGQTPLMFGASGNAVPAIEALLRKGADVGMRDNVLDLVARAEEDEARQRRRFERMRFLMGEDEPVSELVQRRRDGRFRQRVSFARQVGTKGGMTALLYAARQGHVEAIEALLAGGADVDRTSADGTTPLIIATMNGHWDLARKLVEEYGADVTKASDANATPLYVALNLQWHAKSFYPQPTAHEQQEIGHLELMRFFLDRGADPNVRLKKRLWYSEYNTQNQVDTQGATPFWRAAYGTDVDAMKLLLEYGADPTVGAIKGGDAQGDRADSDAEEQEPDPSGLPPVKPGETAVLPIHAASGVGYGHTRVANHHRHVPDGWLPAVRFLVEEVGVDINARDEWGYNAVHHAASRGDNELIEYLVEHGADVTAVSRRGQTTVDMANGPIQRISPFPETIALLESLGAKNNHICVSCGGKDDDR